MRRKRSRPGRRSPIGLACPRAETARSGHVPRLWLVTQWGVTDPDAVCARAASGTTWLHGSDGSRMTTTVARRTGRHLRLWVGVAVAVGVLFMPGLSRTEGLTLSAAD